VSFDPVAMVKAIRRTSLNSQRYIERFETLDTDPIVVTDEATQAQRDCQIVKLCRRICAEQTQGATDAQVLAFHNTFLKGWM
jgi:hypothetical protein